MSGEIRGRLIAARGTRLYVDERGPADAPALLYLHGGPGSGSYDFMSFHPDAPDFLQTPNLDRMAREGAHVANAFVTTSLCSPSRASFLTGKYPSRHGVTLTMTHGDLFPDRRNVPDVLKTVAKLAASGEVPRARLARAFTRGLFRLGPKSGNEPELRD